VREGLPCRRMRDFKPAFLTLLQKEETEELKLKSPTWIGSRERKVE